MSMGEERIPKKMLYARMERRGRPRTRLEMRGENGKKYKKTGSRKIEMAGDFCVSLEMTYYDEFKT